jgi:hypothetical protein
VAREEGESEITRYYVGFYIVFLNVECILEFEMGFGYGFEVRLGR